LGGVGGVCDSDGSGCGGNDSGGGGLRRGAELQGGKGTAVVEKKGREGALGGLCRINTARVAIAGAPIDPATATAGTVLASVGARQAEYPGGGAGVPSPSCRSAQTTPEKAPGPRRTDNRARGRTVAHTHTHAHGGTRTRTH
jgi:hypothetical protein